MIWLLKLKNHDQLSREDIIEEENERKKNQAWILLERVVDADSIGFFERV